MSSTKTSSRRGAGKGDTLAIGGVAFFAVICCAALPLALTVGLGGILSFLTSPWIVVPTLLAVVGIFVWYVKR